jgi:hypothetical protein
VPPPNNRYDHSAPTPIEILYSIRRCHLPGTRPSNTLSQIWHPKDIARLSRLRFVLLCTDFEQPISNHQIACGRWPNLQQLLNRQADLRKRTLFSLIELRSIHHERNAFVPCVLSLTMQILNCSVRKSPATVFARPPSVRRRVISSAILALVLDWWVWRLTTSSKTDQTAVHCSYLLIFIAHSQESLEGRGDACIGSRSFHHFPILI